MKNSLIPFYIPTEDTKTGACERNLLIIFNSNEKILNFPNRMTIILRLKGIQSNKRNSAKSERKSKIERIFFFIHIANEVKLNETQLDQIRVSFSGLLRNNFSIGKIRFNCEFIGNI